MIRFIKKRWYIVVFILVFGGIVLYTQTTQKPQVKKNETFKVKKTTLQDVLTLSGNVDADERVVLRFQTSGRLTWVGVKEGDYVKKYQGIASLDQRELKKTLQKKLNTYMKTRWDFEDAKDEQYPTYWNMTRTEQEAVRRIAEKAQFDLDNSVIDVELQDLSIQYSYLYTPIEGLVVRTDSPFAGVNITPSQAEFEIINPNTVFFSVNADQTEVVKLKQGMVGDIVFDPYPDETIKGEVRQISFTPKAGETGTVYDVKIVLHENNANYKYRLAMTGDISFDTREKRGAIGIPTTYVKTEEGKKYVFKKIGNNKVKSYITIGDEWNGFYEVREGLKENEIIVN